MRVGAVPTHQLSRCPGRERGPVRAVLDRNDGSRHPVSNWHDLAMALKPQRQAFRVRFHASLGCRWVGVRVHGRHPHRSVGCVALVR